MSAMLLLATEASGQMVPMPSLHSNKSVDTILSAGFAYSAVALACGHKKQYYDLKTGVAQLLELSKEKN